MAIELAQALPNAEAWHKGWGSVEELTTICSGMPVCMPARTLRPRNRTRCTGLSIVITAADGCSNISGGQSRPARQVAVSLYCLEHFEVGSHLCPRQL